MAASAEVEALVITAALAADEIADAEIALPDPVFADDDVELEDQVVTVPLLTAIENARVTTKSVWLCHSSR